MSSIAPPMAVKRADWLHSGIRTIAPVLYISLNLLLVYLPTVMKGDLDIGKILGSPDAYGFLVALIFNSILAVVAIYFHKVEESIGDLRSKLEEDGASGHLRRVEQRISELGESIQEDSLRNQVLAQYFEVKRSEYSALFGSLAEDRLERLGAEFSSMSGDRPRYTLHHRPPAEEYIDLFVRIMQRLIDQGTSFDVVTNSTIWSKENFGQSERYLMANITAAKNRDVQVRRVYLVPDLEMLKAQPKEWLAGLYAMLRHHRELTSGTEKLDLLTYLCSEGEYGQRFANNFAVWQVDGRLVCTLIEYSDAPAEQPRILGITFTPDKDIVFEKRAVFQHKFDHAQPLSSYLEQLKGIVEQKNAPHSAS
ncbi:MAG TPA: hypothetical protein VN493_19915 [Thermoanaerobaculia bacterium]|nr:hypothetical protein [Thermoanaerobaculia bacterium]